MYDDVTLYTFAENPSVVRFGGRDLAPEERAQDFLLQCRGGTIAHALYTEKVILVVNLAPHQAPVRRQPSREDAIDELASSISDSIIAELSREDF
jgi:hypothetical protein